MRDIRAAASRECHHCISLVGAFGESFYQRIVGETPLSAISTNPRTLVECAGQPPRAGQPFLLETYMRARFGGDGYVSSVYLKTQIKLLAAANRNRIIVLLSLIVPHLIISITSRIGISTISMSSPSHSNPPDDL